MKYEQLVEQIGKVRILLLDILCEIFSTLEKMTLERSLELATVEEWLDVWLGNYSGVLSELA